MSSVIDQCITKLQNARYIFTKFITANDTGATGGHQAGFHFHINSWKLFFEKPGEKGENKDVFVEIKWQSDVIVQSRFIYYGKGTRNEYRLTRFGKGFPFLTQENIGNLLIMFKSNEGAYDAFVLSTDDDIEDFFALANIAVNETNKVLEPNREQSQEKELFNCFNSYLATLKIDFPTTFELSRQSRECYFNSFPLARRKATLAPDEEILNWIHAEYELFKLIERDRYADRIVKPFAHVEELIQIANTILNRRKSRAGKSLEHHLSEVFNIHQLTFDSQAETEENKRPDFLFPNGFTYRTANDADKLIMLACKTTCKDRWRQILNEADRIRNKHLFTLQQGISKNQLDEMYKSGVQLVVPAKYISSYPPEYHSKILNLRTFISLVQAKALP